MIQCLYNATFLVYTPTYTDGIYGNVAETLTLALGPIRCYITKLSGSKQLFVGKLQIIATHRLFCDPQRVLKSNQKIYVVEQDLWFNILDIDNCSNLGHHYELLLESIEGPLVVQDDDDSSSSSSSSVDSSSSSS